MTRWLERGTRHRQGGLSREQLFDILQNTRRRYAFHYLLQREGPVSISELTDHVAAWENETDVGSVSTEERQRVYVSLLQTHLPKLDRANVVEFDPDAGLVERAENAPSMEIYLETVPENDILWAHYYLGLTAIGFGFVALIWRGIEPFAEYRMVVWFGVVMAFLLSAIIHHRYLGARRLGAEGPPPSEL